MDFFSKLFDTSDFPARWTCGRWTDGHGWLHILSDLGIWAAYFAIPLVLAYFIIRRKDIPFRGVLLLFVAFILLCGLTHLMEAIIFWWPAYRLAGLLKLVTAIISWVTVLSLVPIVPKVLAMRSPEELEREIKAREAAEVELQRTNAELEKRVEERTTKLTEALAALSEERELLRTTLSSIGDGVIVTDSDSRVTFLNSMAEHLTGWATTDASNTPLETVFNIINEHSHQRVENPAARALNEGVIVGLANHTLLINKDGSHRHIDDSAAPIRSKDGTVVGCVLVFRDISDRKQAEKRLIESEARYRAIGESIDYGVWVCDAVGRNTYASPSFLRMVGLTQEQCSEFGWGEVLHPDDAQATIAAWKECVSKQGTWDRTHRFKGVDGQWHHVLARGVPLRDETGKLLGWAGINLDISRLMEAEQEIARLAAESERQRRLYETVLTNTPDFVYVFSLDHRVLYANESLIKMWGRGYDGAIGKTFLEIGYEPWHAEMHDREIDQVRATRQPIRGEVPFNGTHGRREYDYIFVPVIGADGEVEAVAGTTRDVTERKEAERAIRLGEERLRTALAAARMVAWEWTPSDGKLRVSENAADVFGLPAGIGLTGIQQGLALLHPEDISAYQATFQKAIQDRTGYLTHYRLIRPDNGQTIWIEERGNTIFDQPEEGVRLFGVAADVTERHEAEAALRESEERSTFVRRSSGVGFWYCNLPFDVLQWDDLVKSHFFLPPDATVTIQTFYDLLHPDDREPTRQAIELSIATRTQYNVVYRTVDAKTGVVKWIRAIGRTFYAADGTPTRFDGITLDVSEQKWAEERLAFLIRLADTLRSLSDTVEVQAEASRALGEYLRANRVVYFEIQGDEYVIERDYTSGVQPLAGRYPVAAFGTDLLSALLEGRTIIEADATTEPDRPLSEREAFASIQVRGHVDVPLVKGGRFVAGMTVQVSDRREWTRQEVALIEDTAERTWAVVERVRAEREMARLAAEAERERRLFAAVLSNTPDFIYTFNLEGRFVYVNTALLSLWGKRLDEAVGRNFFDLDYPPELADRLQRQIQQVIDTKQPVRDETPYTSDMGERMYEYIFAPVVGAGDAVEAVAGSTRDITNRKVAEFEREQLVGQLKEKDRRKDEFLATLAHELRNPLAPIRNGLQVMRLAGVDGTIEQARTMMERQLTQLIRLVDDLLDVSRVTSGKLELRRERVELKAIIDAAIETTRPVIEQGGHELTIALPKEPIVVEGDPTRLAQIVANLLNNSAKYTPRGGHIKLSVSREQAMAVLVVADNGIGIPVQMLGRVFEMFTQVDRSLEKTTGGLGIGLSLVKGLVEKHGGTIEARSEGEGRGCEFIVRIPLWVTMKEPAESSATPKLAGSSDRRRILVADDNVDSADSLGQLLELLGNDVRTANDGIQALEVAQSFRPDVILLDIGMPKLNGYETCRRLREQPWGKNVMLIALTGWGQDEDKRKSQEAGFDHHLVKPVDPAALQKLLSSGKTA